MKKFILTIFFAASVFLGLGQTNVSLQAGYHGKLYNPRALNAVIDSFNFYNGDLTTQMAPIGNVSGFFGAIGLHPNRSHFRLEAMTYGATTMAIGPDEQGVEQRRDLDLFGARISAGFTSELIEMWPESHFCVGALLNVNYLEINSAVVPAANYEIDDPLDEVMTSWKPSFTIHAPFRIGLGRQVKLSIEPYYQIYFGPTNFREVNAELNPETFANTPLNVEESDLDHLGLNLAVMVFLRPR
jgi:hypothetical protein